MTAAERRNQIESKIIYSIIRKRPKRADITSRYQSLNKASVVGDFRFVVMEKYLSPENDLPWKEKLVMQAYFYLKDFTASEDKWFGLDTSSVKIEKVPMIIMFRGRLSPDDSSHSR